MQKKADKDLNYFAANLESEVTVVICYIVKCQRI